MIPCSIPFDIYFNPFETFTDVNQIGVQQLDYTQGVPITNETGNVFGLQFNLEQQYNFSGNYVPTISVSDMSNPNEVRDQNNMVRERIASDYTMDERGRKRIYDTNWTPEGYEVYEPEIKKKLTVKELLEQRKNRNNPISMMKNSPLNTGHGLDTDERSNNEQEGYDYVYRPEDNVTTTERVELDDGGYKIITRVVTPGTGTQIIEEPGDSGGSGGGSSSGRDFYNPELPNQTWDEWVKAPCPSPGKNRQAGDKYCPPKTDEVEIVNVSEEIFPPDPVEEPDVIPPPSLDLGVPGSSKSSGGSFRFHIPDIDLMGGIRAVIDGVVFTNKGRCKSGCATNKNS